MRRNATEKYRYTVLAAPTQDELDEIGASYENEWDTLRDARRNAKHVLSTEFNAENHCSLGYARILDSRHGNNCINDYFA